MFLRNGYSIANSDRFTIYLISSGDGGLGVVEEAMRNSLVVVAIVVVVDGATVVVTFAAALVNAEAGTPFIENVK